MRNVAVAVTTLFICLICFGVVAAEEIHEAIKRNDVNRVSSILAENPQMVGAREKEAGMTPLHMAVFRGSREIVSILLSKGADVNVSDTKWGFTPLHLAKTKEIAHILIAKGANVNARDKFGGTPLFTAVTGGNLELVGLFLSKGADVNARTNYNMTPLKRAVTSLCDNSTKKEVKCNLPEIINLLKKSGGTE